MATTFEKVLSDLEDAGYDVQSFVIPACGVDAPHRRYRVWIVGYSNENRKSTFSINDETSRMPIMGNTHSEGLEARERGAATCAALREPAGSSSDVADTNALRESDSRHRRAIHNKHGNREEQERERNELKSRTGIHNCNVPDTQGRQNFSSRLTREIPEGHEWPVEPSVGRVANGVPRRMDRLRGLGNAVVPQLVQVFAELIMEIEHQARRVAA